MASIIRFLQDNGMDVTYTTKDAAEEGGSDLEQLLAEVPFGETAEPLP